MSDGEVQRRGAVAACSVGALVGGTIGGIPVGGAVPGQRVANVLLVDATVAVPHGKVQRGGAVAALRVGTVVGRCAGGCIIECAVPGQRIAHTLFVCSMGAVAHGEVQCVHLYAVVRVGVTVRVVSAGSVGGTVPGKGLAGAFGDGRVRRVEYREGHHHGAVDPIVRCQHGLLCSGCLELHAVPFVGQLAVADGALVVADDGFAEPVNLDGHRAGVAAGTVTQHGHQLHLVCALRQGVERVDGCRGGTVVEYP